MGVEKAIIARRICPVPQATCFRGRCILCNYNDFKDIHSIEAYAYSHGYGRDFVAGRINDFLHAEVLREV